MTGRRHLDTNLAEFRQLKNILKRPEQLERSRLIPIEELQVREYIAAFAALAVLVFISSFPLSLGIPPQAPLPGHIQAPWMFGGIQWLLLRLPVVLAGWIIPGASFVFLLSLPWWASTIAGRWVRIGFAAFALFWLGITLAYVFQV